ncbi:hypothetical protein TNCV_3419301 [Trichonephila clavipes]|nr:hypothetical protein TNCV_3419301 [Trichonephila clavipes]
MISGPTVWNDLWNGQLDLQTGIDKHLWDYLGREVAALNPPPIGRYYFELKKAYSVSGLPLFRYPTTFIINSMGNRGTAFKTATAGSDGVQSGRPIFDDFFQHLCKDPPCRAAMHVKSVES